MECLLPYLCMATVPHIMVGLERMLDYRGVGLARFHCTYTFPHMPAECILQLYVEVITGVCGGHYGCPQISARTSTYYCMHACMWFVYVHTYVTLQTTTVYQCN